MNKLRKKWDVLATHIPAALKNRYVITFILFFLWMLFFDRNDIISTIKLRRQLAEWQRQKAYYEEELKKTTELRNALLQKNENLEKFAREKFLMKKDNEVLYVIVEE